MRLKSRHERKNRTSLHSVLFSCELKQNGTVTQPKILTESNGQ